MTNMTVGEGFVKNPNRIYLEEYFDTKPFINNLLHSSITERGTINTNTTTKTSLSNVTIPANSLIVGDVLHIQGVGKIINATGNPTTTVALEFGPTNPTGGNVIITNSVTNTQADDDVYIDAYITIRTIGSSGTAIGNGQLRVDNAGSDLVNNITSEFSIDTTVTNYVSLNNTWGAANTDNQIAADTFTFDTFIPNGNAPNHHIQLTGTNAKNSGISYSTTKGGILVETESVNGDQMILEPHGDADQTAWNNIKFGTENQVEWECALHTNGDITNMSMWGGLKLTSVPEYATDSDQAYFLYSTNDTQGTLQANGNLYFIYSVGNTDYITNLGIVVNTNSIYNLKIMIDEDRKLKIYVNNTQYGLVTNAGENTVSDSSQLSIALTNDVDLKPIIGLQTLETASKNITISYEKISRNTFE